MTDITICWQLLWTTGTQVLVGMQNNTAILANRWALSHKVNIYPYSPEITFPDIYQREIKVYVHINIYTWMFMTTLLIASNLKQS